MKNSNLTLPSVHSFEEYEKLKLNAEFFKSVAKEIIHQHQLPDGPLSLFEGTNIVVGSGCFFNSRGQGASQRIFNFIWLFAT